MTSNRKRIPQVEVWDPSYGSPIQTATPKTQSGFTVDATIETTNWEPIPGNADTAPQEVVIVDGTLRQEARLTCPESENSNRISYGIIGAYAAGAVIWNRNIPASRFAHMENRRVLIAPQNWPSFLEDGLVNTAVEEHHADCQEWDELQKILLNKMKELEQTVAREATGTGRLIITDGRVRIPGSVDCPVVGYIKSQMVRYTPERQYMQVAENLEPGERSPLFLIRQNRDHYISWYVRLADTSNRLSGIARCEIIDQSDVEQAAVTAGWVSGLLPSLVAPVYMEPRWPQNLVPIGTLEKELTDRMGAADLIRKYIMDAVHVFRSA